MASIWGVTPKASIEAECQRRSRTAVIHDCILLLDSKRVDPDFVRVLGGPPAEVILEGGAGGIEGYWPRVWAARGLLHIWDDSATTAIIAATSHEQWRVREMSAKVIAAHNVRAAIDAVVALLDDDNARVRVAARRAFAVVAD
ncbi:MAG TPA: HEAT repeat domain-containing protein [Acidimicrobiales bacterium]